MGRGVKGRCVVVGGEGVYVTGVKGRGGRVDRGVRGEGWGGWMRDVRERVGRVDEGCEGEGWGGWMRDVKGRGGEDG